MRRRLVLGTVLVIVAVLTALVPPVVILLRRAAERELEVRLSSQAADVSVAISDDILSGTTDNMGEQIAQIIPIGDSLVVLDSDGIELIHFGDPVSSAVTGTADGPRGTTIRVSTSDVALSSRVRGPLLALGAFAVLSVALGAVLASIVARRLTRPLDDLARTAQRLGAGDFSAAVPAPSGIAEIDGIGAALSTSATRLDQMLASERSFTGDATHQLRTGLAGISLRLELIAAHGDPAVRDDAEQAQMQLDRLSQTLDELLALARGAAGEQRADVDVHALVAAHCADWRSRAQRERRSVELGGESPTWRVTPGFVGQVLDVLLDNALQHGRGAIVVTIHARSLTVRDEGVLDASTCALLFDGPEPVADADQPPSMPAHGRGLALARRLARADGGSLELSTPGGGPAVLPANGSGPTTSFTLTYPPIAPPAPTSPAAVS